MDCARFLEENGTLENQVGAPSSERERKRDGEILYFTSIHGTVTWPVYTGQKSLDSRLPTVLGDRVRFEIRRSRKQERSVNLSSQHLHGVFSLPLVIRKQIKLDTMKRVTLL